MAGEPKVPEGWVDEPWDGDAAQWDSAEDYCGACLIDLNAKGEKKTKDLCMLPFKNPSGKTSVRGVIAAAGGRGITRVEKPQDVSPAKWETAKRAAAKKLIKLYGMMNREPPEMMMRMAG